MKKKIFATITSLAFVFTPIQGVEAAGFLARLFPGWSAARHSHNYSHRYGDSYGSSGGYSGYGSSGGSYSGTYGDSSGHYHYEYKKGKFTYEDESGNTVEQDAEMPVKVYGDAPVSNYYAPGIRSDDDCYIDRHGRRICPGRMSQADTCECGENCDCEDCECPNCTCNQSIAGISAPGMAIDSLVGIRAPEVDNFRVSLRGQKAPEVVSSQYASL